MNDIPAPSPFYIGWDVGGWNCDKNNKCRDAIVILDAELKVYGTPWRGNLRSAINKAADSEEFIGELFELCGLQPNTAEPQFTIAIDTPLGFSKAFVRLITGGQDAGEIGNSKTNPYLFRKTELYLFKHGLAPLSAIKDMIGSQATKGIHVLAKFELTTKSCGVWTDDIALTAIEAYPAACKNSKRIKDLVGSQKLGHPDKDDALKCALIAYLFSNEREALEQPPSDVPDSEGWIWLPRDGFPQNLG